jgi:hypothetical protein
MWYRRRKYGETFRRINLGEGEFTLVDSRDYYRLGRFKWSVAGGDDGKMYAARILRKTVCGRIKTMYLHREIMNAPKGLLVDHKNSNSLDNRRSNLRLATASQNMQNVAKKKNTSSRFIGVYLKSDGKWGGQIKREGKKKWLGSFDSEINAARAYDAAAREYHGEFARFNFPAPQNSIFAQP